MGGGECPCRHISPTQIESSCEFSCSSRLKTCVCVRACVCVCVLDHHEIRSVDLFAEFLLEGSKA